MFSLFLYVRSHIQQKPLSPTLSPSDGEREKHEKAFAAMYGSVSSISVWFNQFHGQFGHYIVTITVTIKVKK